MAPERAPAPGDDREDRVHPLQETDRRYIHQVRQGWKVERVAWALMAAFVLAALLGLFGDGPVSWASAELGAGEVRYERFVRRGGQTGLAVTVAAAPDAEGTVEVWVEGGWLDEMQVEQITPQPAAVVERAGGTSFEFEVAGPRQQLDVRFALRPEGLGPVDGQLRLGDGTEAEFRQFIYP